MHVTPAAHTDAGNPEMPPTWPETSSTHPHSLCVCTKSFKSRDKDWKLSEDPGCHGWFLHLISHVKPGFRCKFPTTCRTLQLSHHFPVFTVFKLLLQTLPLKRFHQISKIGGGYLRRMICWGGQKKAVVISEYSFVSPPLPTAWQRPVGRSRVLRRARSSGEDAALWWVRSFGVSQTMLVDGGESVMMRLYPGVSLRSVPCQCCCCSCWCWCWCWKWQLMGL